MNPARLPILLTGATGYVGGHVLPRLVERGETVRCLVRDPDRLDAPPSPSVEVVRGNVLDAASLAPAMRGVGTAYYLVHSMGSRGDFVEKDRAAAETFARAARDAGVRRIVYLGGLGDPGDDLSPHLRSRQEVGEVLRAAGVEVIEFRASIVVGSGSLSFELARTLVERLPVMICPRWVRTPAQPIAVDDVLAYLVGALDLPPGDSRVFEIGGRDRVTYADIMREYGRQRGLRRWMIPVPVLTPYLSSLWLGLVTPVYAHIGRRLVEGARNRTVVRDPAARDAFPIRPVGLREAVRRALEEEDASFRDRPLADRLAMGDAGDVHVSRRVGHRILDGRQVHVGVPPEAAFAPIRRIGGTTGWYYGNGLWQARGRLDQLVGGVGVRRGRRDPETLTVGDALDFWRVEAYEPNRRLRLAAEMRLPGRAWLEFEVRPAAEGALIRQTALFDPRGLAGRLYWYALLPVHHRIFAGMLRGIARAAEAGSAAAEGMSGG